MFPASADEGFRGGSALCAKHLSHGRREAYIRPWTLVFEGAYLLDCRSGTKLRKQCADVSEHWIDAQHHQQVPSVRSRQTATFWRLRVTLSRNVSILYSVSIIWCRRKHCTAQYAAAGCTLCTQGTLYSNIISYWAFRRDKHCVALTPTIHRYKTAKWPHRDGNNGRNQKCRNDDAETASDFSVVFKTLFI